MRSELRGTYGTSNEALGVRRTMPRCSLRLVGLVWAWKASFPRDLILDHRETRGSGGVRASQRSDENGYESTRHVERGSEIEYSDVVCCSRLKTTQG